MHKSAAWFAFLLSLSGALLRGQTWTVGRAGIPGATAANSVAFGNGRFVVALDSPSGQPHVVWSADGLSWSGAADAVSGYSVAFAGDAFFLAGSDGIWRSSDGATWSRVYQGRTVYRWMATDGKSMLVGTANINVRTMLYSPDLLTWRETAPLPAPADATVSPQDLGFLGGRFFANCFLRLAGGNLRSVTYATDDGGATWSQVTALDGAYMLATGNARLVALQPGGLTTAGDDLVFQTRPASVNSNGGYLAFAGGRFFFAGSLEASLDGTGWAQLAPLPNLPPNRQLSAAAYGNGRYVIVGYGPTPGGTVPADIVLTLAAPAPPIFATSPADRTIAVGDSTTLRATLENPDTATRFQWLHDGRPIPGASLATYAIAGATAAESGSYAVRATNAVGTVQSASAQLEVVPRHEAARLVNLSVLTSLDGTASSFIVGVVLGGAGTSGNTPLLVRAVGPTLADFGVAGPVADPRLTVISRTFRAENDDWAGSAALTAAATRVGAFPLRGADSRDAAFHSGSFSAGDTSVTIGASGSGAVLAEIYADVTVTPATVLLPRLINISVLKPLAGGASLDAGFVIAGRGGKTVLVRGVGPGLAAVGVAGALPNPALTLYRQGAITALAHNDDWGGAAETTAAATAVGAFALPPDSRDAALLVTLPAGVYTAQVVGSGPGSGLVLVEIYEVP